MLESGDGEAGCGLLPSPFVWRPIAKSVGWQDKARQAQCLVGTEIFEKLEVNGRAVLRLPLGTT